MKIATVTLGCKVNQYETQAMERALEQRGHLLCRLDASPDAVIINTCAVTAEAERIRKRDVDIAVTSLVRNDIEVTVGVGYFVIDGRRHKAVLQRKRCDDRFDRTCRTEKVTCHRLCGADHKLVCVSAERTSYRSCLTGIIERCSCTMSVDVINLFGLDARIV